MSQTIYASFAELDQAEKAAGALLDYGVERDDFSLIANGSTQQPQEQEVGTQIPVFALNPNPQTLAYGIGSFPTNAVPVYPSLDEPNHTDEFNGGTRTAEYVDTTTYPGDLRTNPYNESYRSDTTGDRQAGEFVAKTGITTTTAEDAEVGAIKGTGYGLGLGILAGIASLIVPGVGLVLGGGALAAALGLTALTAGAGAVTGGIVGYLKDQGVGETEAAKYQQTIGAGGALLAVNIPSNGVDLQTAEMVLNKYGATDISAY